VWLEARGASAAFFEEAEAEAADVAADVRARLLDATAPPRSAIFEHVYSEPHPLVEAQAAWLEAYENSFEGEGQ
jgi:pyruvate dehydrogenase E1 component alpha subunit